MDIALVIIGIILLIVGIVGCFVPGLPGVPFSYAALIMLELSKYGDFSWVFLTIWFIVTVAVQVLDFFVPTWGTKKLGGGRAGMWGATIGLFVGLFWGGWGALIAPFFGALIGELIAGKRASVAFKAALGSFLGLMAGTVMKLVCCLVMTIYFFIELF